MRLTIDFALVFCVRVQTRGCNFAQDDRSDLVDSSAESGGRGGVFAVESGSLSQLSEALWAEKCFLGEKTLNWQNFQNRKSDRAGDWSDRRA